MKTTTGIRRMKGFLNVLGMRKISWIDIYCFVILAAYIAWRVVVFLKRH